MQILNQLEQCKAFPDFNNYLAFICAQADSLPIEVRLLGPRATYVYVACFNRQQMIAEALQGCLPPALRTQGTAVVPGSSERGAPSQEQPQRSVCGNYGGLQALHQGEGPSSLVHRRQDSLYAPREAGATGQRWWLPEQLFAVQLALLHAIGNPSKPLRHTVGTNVAVIVGVGGLPTWPELLSAIVHCLESNDPDSLEGALDALYKVS